MPSLSLFALSCLCSLSPSPWSYDSRTRFKPLLSYAISPYLAVAFRFVLLTAHTSPEPRQSSSRTCRLRRLWLLAVFKAGVFFAHPACSFAFSLQWPSQAFEYHYLSSGMPLEHPLVSSIFQQWEVKTCVAYFDQLCFSFSRFPLPSWGSSAITQSSVSSGLPPRDRCAYCQALEPSFWAFLKACG